ncbi:MAG: urea ABC transporter permease subunit UrtB [Pseudomonadota bacterium]
MYRIPFLIFLAFWLGLSAVHAQEPVERFQAVLENNFKLISRSSVKTIGPVLEELEASGFEKTAEFLGKWQSKDLWFHRKDKLFFYVSTEDKKTYQLIDITTGETVREAAKKEIRQVKPNSGVRALLGSALVKFRLISPEIEERQAGLESISRKPKPEHLDALRQALESEDDPEFRADLSKLERLLTIQFAEAVDERVQAIKEFDGALDIEVRAKLNPLLSSKIAFAADPPEGENVARIVTPGESYVLADGTSSSNAVTAWMNDLNIELSVGDAYQMLVAAGEKPALVDRKTRDAAISSNVNDGTVAGVEVASLNTEAARDEAYARLAEQGIVEPAPTSKDVAEAVSSFTFYAVYNEKDPVVTDALKETVNSINSTVRWNEYLDLMLDAVSLASIYFLAAIGLAITFGVMRVINMAHGEFIMMGAYSGYVVQQVITNYTLSIIVAIPFAFAVTFLAGVALERLVIRHLYNRPLETLLATFGVSIALQQLAKNIFGTQARPLTAPEWLDGALVINDVVSISWIRIAIFVLGLIFFVGLWITLNKTRLGLETRAVTQNPRMAASMGINPDRINMLTFGLGSGIAGIAGVAIGLYAKVTSELGGDYIVQSFMTFVIGGVGNIWGTLAGAGLIGILQKLIENFNPSNTLAAQTFMIIFIIIFIQFRPRGLIALKGRAAEA